jgi:CheY-like chemotaxis protein
MPSAFEFHEAPTQPDTQGARAPTKDSPLVLVVDDDEDTRAIYTYSLEQMGYRTWTESSGEEGLVAARLLRPFAILMDVAMPGMDGIETTRLLRADPRTHTALIVVVTAHGAVKFSEARRAGCDAYFCKPFNPFALDEVLRTLRTPGEPRPSERATVYKRCGCGRWYTIDQWLALPLCGRMHLPKAATMELRNCACGSSLAMPLGDD